MEIIKIKLPAQVSLLRVTLFPAFPSFLATAPGRLQRFEEVKTCVFLQKAQGLPQWPVDQAEADGRMLPWGPRDSMSSSVLVSTPGNAIDQGNLLLS